MNESKSKSPSAMIGKRSSCFRGFQPLIYVVIIFTCLIIAYVHIKDEIARLDTARMRIEQAVSHLQEETLKAGQRRHFLSSPSQAIAPVKPEDDVVMIYNRVPKTGSTSFTNIAYSLCSVNNFHVLHLNVTKNSHILSIADQRRFITNVTTWNEKKPAFYHGHLAYLEFNRFGVVKKPMFINIIRDPLDRLVSYYYFMRHGDDYRPNLKRRRSYDKKTFDDCVAEGGKDCDPGELWVQVPFFCGHAQKCLEVGSQWALDQAKHNLINNYLAVGLTEHLQDFVAVLEMAAPRFFKGALQLFMEGKKSHLRKTFNKQEPSEETVAKIQASVSWKLEDEFYNFAKQHFVDMKRKMFGELDDSYQPKQKQFRYEKVRPR